jgi:hypothetical protein
MIRPETSQEITAMVETSRGAGCTVSTSLLPPRTIGYVTIA